MARDGEATGLANVRIEAAQAFRGRYDVEPGYLPWHCPELEHHRAHIEVAGDGVLLLRLVETRPDASSWETVESSVCASGLAGGGTPRVSLNARSLRLPTCWVRNTPLDARTRAVSLGSSAPWRLRTRVTFPSAKGNAEALPGRTSTPSGVSRAVAMGTFGA